MRQIDLFALGILAAGGNLLGGAMVMRRRPASERQLQMASAVGAGFLLAVVCLEILPAALQEAGPAKTRTMLLFVTGYLSLLGLGQVFAGHAHAHAPAEGASLHPQPCPADRAAALRVVGALTLHTFFDGVAIGSAGTAGPGVGLMLALAALLHKVPEGLTISSVLLAAGYPRSRARGATLLLALSTLFGVVSVMAFQPPAGSALPFAGGAAFYVAASDLIPEAKRRGGALSLLAVVGGIGLFWLAHLLMHGAGLK